MLKTHRLIHVPLMLASLLFLAPLAWMFCTSLKTDTDIINGLGSLRWLPSTPTLSNYRSVLGNAAEFPVWRWTVNSLFVSLGTSALVLIVDSLAAYAYARLRWRGRDKMFNVLVATMLVPSQVLLIPTYLVIRQLGWFDTYWALIVPASAGSFGVFLLRQFMRSIPVELEEAAKLDGCSSFGIYWHVILPLLRPALATLGIFTFMASWNAFESPLIFTDSVSMRTLPIGIAIFQGHYGTQYGQMMAAATLAMLPVVTTFLMFQRHIIRGISLTGLAGR